MGRGVGDGGGELERERALGLGFSPGLNKRLTLPLNDTEDTGPSPVIP